MHNKPWDSLWINGSIVSCDNGYGLIQEGAIAAKAGKICWVGSMQDLPDSPENLANIVQNLNGYCLTPGFIDCHTHCIYAGNRAGEFEQRLQGISYEDIARAGGGIQSTVAATRQASEAELLQQSLPRIQALWNSGVTTIEIKSGYGLDTETELKILRVAKQIEKWLPISVYSTFLGAHTIPREFRQQPDAYVDLVCNEMLPRVADQQLASAIDVFCETIAFDLSQTEKIFQTAQQLGLNIKCHSEQLSNSGSAELAAKYHALSVDHLEHITDEGIAAIAKSNTVAVLLPGAFYFLRETQLPPINKLRAKAIPIALASDCNPGTSPIVSLLVILNMACTLFRLTPEEALLGVTKHAAAALGIQATHGTLTIGKVADFAIWKVKHPAELAYYLGMQPLLALVKDGQTLSKV